MGEGGQEGTMDDFSDPFLSALPYTIQISSSTNRENNLLAVYVYTIA